MMISEFLKKHSITGIETDSRLVKPGMVFIAISKKFAVQHCMQAIENGASVIIANHQAKQHLDLCKVSFEASEKPSLDLVKLAADYYKPLPNFNVAVTGTNGKSSVVSLLRQLWQHCGYQAASIGTVGVETSHVIDSEILKNLPSLTTLDGLSFFKVLSALKEFDFDHVAFEASSIGIDQYRCYGLPLTAAAFTNFTQDHLDYHEDMENYFHAKSKLFSEILEPFKTAVLNINSNGFDQLEAIAKNRKQLIITYGVNNASADFNAYNISINGHSINFDLQVYGSKYNGLILPLAGEFQLENLLCALGLATASGIELGRLLSVLPLLKSVKGRMEYAASFNGANIYVDYAHTPDALERSLVSLRQHTANNLWVLFGCGGNRDSVKRPMMGLIACRYADRVILSDDNPRFENPDFIRKEILKGCDFKAIEIADRSKAIVSAIAQLKNGDTLLVAGKGHETGQIIADKVMPFDDVLQIKAAVMECQ